jgi:galactose oxidase-like protein/carboxypeptidase family protein
MKITQLLFVVCVLHSSSSAQVTSRSASPLRPAVAGSVQQLGTLAPVPGARLTLFTPDLGFFREVRSDTSGAFLFTGIPPGTYRLGAEALGFDYVEVAVSPGVRVLIQRFLLVPESHPGAWQVIGNTLPEFFDATDIAALRPLDGTVMFCHDTSDPILFDPRTGQKALAADSGSEQGCMNTTLLADGSVLFVGGQDGEDPGDFVNAIPWVKRFWPAGFWQRLADMLAPAGRWYPGLVRLADGRLLVMGGGTAPSAARTDTCELFDPATLTWSWTGTMNSALEFPPAALLYTGKVLRTWGAAPELYDPLTGQWLPTGALVYANRLWPGHSDHSLLVLSDERALVVGIVGPAQASAAMTEFYDPATGTWSAGTSPSLKRMQCEIVYLPDGRVLVQGGESANPGAEPDVIGIVKRTDIFDPATLAWRRVADTPQFREYHAVTLLLPDGRVLTTGGTTIKFQVGPTSADIDAYSPPYLFRGVRPGLSSLSDHQPSRGEVLSFDVFPATRLTRVVLMGVQSTTHWVDGGIPRRLELAVQQSGRRASCTLPADPNLLPLGWYMLFGMVDDIPSEALFMRVGP